MMNSFKRFFDHLTGFSRFTHLCIGILSFLFIAYFDYKSGPETTASIFYLIPVVYLGWFCHEMVGIAAALIGMITWLILDYNPLDFTPNGHHPLIPYWNITIRGGIFLIASVICVRLQDAVKTERRLNKQIAEHAQDIIRLANIKSEFASMVSHELRTPLTALKENLAIVYDGSAGPLTDEQKDFLETAKRNIDRLSRLINDILDFQRLESGRMPFRFQSEDLNVLVQEACSHYIPLAAKKGLELKADLDPSLPPVEIDRDRINQVLVNLIQNAIRYTDHGSISVRTKFLSDKISLSVEDQGCGIEAQEMPKLFQSFQRLLAPNTTRAEGTGLGLAISKRIIEAHHGSIEVKSRPGEGSIFTVILKSSFEKVLRRG